LKGKVMMTTTTAEHIRGGISPQADVFARIVNQYQVLADITTFTSLVSRHVDHAGNAIAVQLLANLVAGMGRGYEVTTPIFPSRENRMLKNVIARLPGRGTLKDYIVIVSAHLDSTGALDPGYQPRVDPAPGADDDASGMAGVLAAARAIGELASTWEGPRCEIVFAFFNAEEQRQIGSFYYASEIVSPSNVRGVYHLDMIGYNARNPPRTAELHAGASETSGVGESSQRLATRVKASAAVVSPELQWLEFSGADDPALDFSDHTRFHQESIPACLICENFFGGMRDANLDYHLPEDTIENIDSSYAADIARAVAAAAWAHAIEAIPPEDAERSRPEARD
jgi:leucyl aminopeptidase